MCLPHIFPRHNTLHYTLKSSVYEPWKYVLDKKVAQLHLVLETPRPELASLHARPLGHEAGNVDANLSNGPVQLSQLHNAAIEGKHVKIRLEVRSAKEIDHKVNPLAAVQSLDFACPRVLVRVSLHIDGGGCAKLGDGEVALLLFAGSSGDLRGRGGRGVAEVSVRGELDAGDRHG